MHTTKMSFKAIGRQPADYTVVSRLVGKTHTQTNNVRLAKIRQTMGNI
jgi:hypothetical protein